jgi:cytochrome c oxidase subunit III
VSARATIDVSHIPDHAFGSRSIMWWSTMSIIAIEGTVFVLAIASYFYLQGNENAWPPPDTPLPGYFWGTINVFVMLISCLPNQIVKKAAEHKDVHKVRLWMVIADLLAIVFIVIRVFEYAHLNVNWDSNAYGSAIWTLLSLHTVHLVTDFFDSAVLTVLMFTRHCKDPRRLVDVYENAFYWYFVVFSWLPIYAVLYWAPRVL